MKNKISLLIFMIFCSFVNIYTLKADCEDSIKEAEQIIVKTENVVDETRAVFIYLVIENITPNTYVVVMNDYEDEFNPKDATRTIKYEDTENGTIRIKSPNIYKKINYVVKAYTKDSSCSIEAVKSKNVKTDVFNKYSAYQECDDAEGVKICESFKDTSKIEEEEFKEIVEKEKIELNKTTKDKVFEAISKYYLYVLIPITLISAIYITLIVRAKRGKNQ